MSRARNYQTRHRWRSVVHAAWALSLCGLWLMSGVVRADSPPRDVRTAKDLYQAGQYRQAVEMLDRLLEPQAATGFSEPALVSALDLAVEVNRASGRYEAALQYALRREQLLEHQANGSSVKLNAQRQAVALTVADLQMSLEQPEAAEKSLRTALALPEGARLNDPVWEADAQVRLARAIAAQGNSREMSTLSLRAKQQWIIAEAQAKRAVDDCLQKNAAAEELVRAGKLEIECLLALDRPGDGAKLVERLLPSGGQNLDEMSRIELNGELAACLHAERQFAGERTVLEQTLDWQQQADHSEPTVAQAGWLNRLAISQQAMGENALAEEKWKAAAKVYRQLLDQTAGKVGTAPAGRKWNS